MTRGAEKPWGAALWAVAGVLLFPVSLFFVVDAARCGPGHAIFHGFFLMLYSALLPPALGAAALAILLAPPSQHLLRIGLTVCASLAVVGAAFVIAFLIGGMQDPAFCVTAPI